VGALTDAFGQAQQWLFETIVQPLCFALGLGGRLEEAFAGTGWLLVGLLQIAVMVLVIAPLQRRWPVEPLRDVSAVRTDVIYTLLHRLGAFRLLLFFTLEPWMDELFGWLRVAGVGTLHLDGIWPGVSDVAIVSFLLYLVAFDFVDYWIHRGQHRFRWWWNLHALHHSQRQMTMWSDSRNHLLDDLLRDAILVVVAQLIGIGPGQFVAIVAVTQLSENLHHANLRMWFGTVGERLWVSPRFHRRHHSIGVGHESRGRDSLGGCNFAVLLPWWDVLFGTADFERRYDPTGIRDQVEPGPNGVRDYGRGFWAQQRLGLARLMGRG
jgi:sterol desaturase/sphingolipid hydroxylase (fatty acid hydroxylase superfamily)